MIALLLGSFNPIHNGHLALARYTLDRGLASEVWFVVTPQNPMKSPFELAPIDHRIEMARIALADEHSMHVCDIESRLPYPSYTINTLRALRDQYPDKEFVILAGSDIADQLPKWRESEEVQRLAKFLIYPRGSNTKQFSPEMATAPRIDIDSTRCRTALYPPTPAVVESLSAGVIEYIHTHKLYKMKTIEQYNTLIENDPKSDIYHLERGDLFYHQGKFGDALNDFNTALELNPENVKAQQMKNMTESIFEFRHSDIYNP